MNTKKIIGVGTLAVTLVAASTFDAQAQSITPDPTLSLSFATDGGLQSTGTVATRGLGVGYDPANDFSQFVNSLTPSATQSIYNPLITSTYSFGTAFQTIAAGSTFQLGLHAFGHDGTGTAEASNPVSINAAMFAFNPNAAAGTLPVTGSAIFDTSVLLAPQNNTTDQIYFSNTFTLKNAIVANTEYVMAFHTDPSNPVEYTTADRTNFATSGLSAADASIFKQYYIVDNNSGDAGGAFKSHPAGGLTQPVGYRFYSEAPPAVPEASSLISLGTLLSLGGLFLVRRRKAC